MTATAANPVEAAFIEQSVARAYLWDMDDPLPFFRAHVRDWIEAHLVVQTKDERVVPFLLNVAQRDFYEQWTGRDIILKPRQLGFSTEIQGLFFANCLLRPNTTSVIVAHDQRSAEQIFGIAKLFWEGLPEPERSRVGHAKYDNVREFYWPGIHSRFLVGSASSQSFGRGQTINNLHCSELAFWPRPEESLTALMEAVPAGGRIVIESTANGVGNYFHDLWMAAKGRANEFMPHLYVWWEDPEYRIEPTDEELATWKRELSTLGLVAPS